MYVSNYKKVTPLHVEKFEQIKIELNNPNFKAYYCAEIVFLKLWVPVKFTVQCTTILVREELIFKNKVNKINKIRICFRILSTMFPEAEATNKAVNR